MAPEQPAVSAQADLESTAELLALVRSGDSEARERLFARTLPVLQRWAHGRLPAGARGTAETDDLVQVTLLRALNRVEEFEPRREGAFLAYLRSILLNCVRDEIRRTVRAPAPEALSPEMEERLPSRVEEAAGRDTVAAYEAALGTLPAEHQEAVILRVEFGFSYPEIAAALGKPSAGAARMAVSRALVRLAEAMG